MKYKDKTGAHISDEAGQTLESKPLSESTETEAQEGKEPLRTEEELCFRLDDPASGDPDSFEATQSICLDSLFTRELTTTGSFSFGGIDHTWFGKLVQSLPIPALLIDEQSNIIFVNRSCGRVSPDYKLIEGKPFSSLFSNIWVGKEVLSTMERVLATRKPELVQAVVGIGKGKVWGRIHFRSLRLGGNRCILVLVEDLTLEKEQLLLKQEHEKQILRERDDLEKRVQERTAELIESNRRLRLEIAEKKRVEQSSRVGEERYRMLVENAPVGIISCDTEGKVIECNEAVTKILGSPSPEATAALNLLSFSSPVEARVASAIRRCLESGESIVDEFPYRSPWEAQIYARLLVAPIRGGDGSITGAQAVIEDISVEKRAESLLLRSERLKALIEMAGGLTRNFNRSLQVVAGDAQIALNCLESRDFSQMRPLLEQIRDSTRDASQTLRRLQLFAGAQSEREGLAGKSFNLDEVVREGIEESAPWWKTYPEKQGIEVVLVDDLAEHCHIEGEPEEIKEVVTNLIKNAAEALPTGGTISVKVFGKEDYVFLLVEDDGVGIPKKNLEKMFEPFWTSKPAHAGMGLAVSQGIVGRHGGTIAVEGREREGSAFTIKFPKAKKLPMRDHAGGDPNSTRDFRILLIGADEPAFRKLGGGLKKLGQEAFIATSGEQALELLRNMEVDSVVCDMEMEGANAWSISKQIETAFIERGMRRPPIVLLATPGSKIAEEVMLSNPYVDRVVEKPIEASRLLEVVRGEVRGAAVSDAFSGSIYGIDILEYVQLVLLTGQRAVVEIRSREGIRGLLYIDRGTVRHATCGDVVGEEAFHRCLNFRAGSFSSLPWREPERNSINKPGEYLLFEAARKRDEADGRGRAQQGRRSHES